ncbi:MAG: type IV secretory system conjugative DNA transfer family protein [Thermoanaerobaculia bacterium]|nr:type IV secretory system conjugative DNA transfer family protein [Thermoanaerobaculia bacterium]
MDRPLLHLTDTDLWTVRDAVGGAVIFGGPGSGKSSGPGRHIALSMLESQMGGVVLAAKPGEARKWLDYATETGRLDDVVVFSPEYPELRINPLDQELRRVGRGAGYTANVTSLFEILLEITEGGRKDGDGEKFWHRATIELMTHATNVLHAAGETVSLVNIHELIQSVPRRSEAVDEFHEDIWRDHSYCWQCMARAVGQDFQDVVPERQQDLEMAASYLCEEFPRLAERTRGSIIATMKGMALPFLQSPLREVFGSETTLRLEDIFDHRTILICDWPLKTFASVGRIANGLMKYLFQVAAERRSVGRNTVPAFLFVDEAQLFITSRDAEFMATARESRICTTFITQNISNLYSAVRAPNAKHVVDSLLANFNTKCFAANSDALTNRWAADLIAQSWQLMAGSSTTTGQQASTGATLNQQLAYRILPGEFLTLQTGGPPEFLVESIVAQGGRVFHHTDAPYGRIVFPQEPERSPR